MPLGERLALRGEHGLANSWNGPFGPLVQSGKDNLVTWITTEKSGQVPELSRKTGMHEKDAHSTSLLKNNVFDYLSLMAMRVVLMMGLRRY